MSVFNQSRSSIIRLIIIAMFVIIAGRLFMLQVLTSKYQKLAQDNALYVKTVYPDRGIVYDRKGNAILNNSRAYDLMVTPNQIKNPDTFYLCKLLDIDTAEFKKRVITAIYKNGRYRPSVFQGLLSTEQYARINENMWKFTGFDLLERPIRSYPYSVGAHIFGYIGEVDSAAIRRSGGYYKMGDFVGKSGLENTYEKVLMGQRGVEVLVRDNLNRIQGSYDNGRYDTMPVVGRNLHTFLDIELQQMAERMLKDKVGGVVAINPQTGGILAMASGPTFDPNDLTGSERSRNYSNMVLDVARPLMNRAVQGRYEPGSTFKPIGGLVALDEGLITPSFGYPCFGRYTACGSGKPACTHSNVGHAANLRIATANSCNSYFTHLYRLAVDNKKYKNVKEGYMKWKEYMNAFGLGTRLGVDLPAEDPGFIPDTSDYNREYRGSWNSCTNLTLGIGQDKMGATPLQLANAMCVIANRGYYYTPRIVERIEDATASDSAMMNQYKQKHEVLSHVADPVFQAIMDGMEDVVTYGTARNSAIPNIQVCAKTGTAEKYIFMDGKRIKLENNAVFVAFAPKENPTIAIAVVMENAGYGGTWGGPIARVLMEQYLNDSLSEKSKADLERMSTTSRMPPHLKRLQFREDSVRAYQWLQLYKDSSQIRRFFEKYKKSPGTIVKNNKTGREFSNEFLLGHYSALIEMGPLRYPEPHYPAHTIIKDQFIAATERQPDPAKTPGYKYHAFNPYFLDPRNNLPLSSLKSPYKAIWI